MGAAGSRGLAVVASGEAGPRLEELGLLGDGFEVRLLPPSALAPLRSSYHSAALAIVAEQRAMPLALLVQRFMRVPWIAVADRRALELLAAGGGGLELAALVRAPAVLVTPDLVAEAAKTLPRARAISVDDAERVRALIMDLALAADARGDVQRRLRVIPDAWMFTNDRATRLAIRLTKATGKAPDPLHPKHFLTAPWFAWYGDKLRAGDTVLDVGCGNGAHTVGAARRVRRVVGIDVDASALDHAARRAAREGVRNVEFVRGDLADPRTLTLLGSKRFDVVMALDVLEHLSHRQPFLIAIRGLLRPGGRLLVSVPNRATPYKLWRRRLGGFAYADPDHKVEYTERMLTAELEEAGFRLLRLERGGYDTPFPGLTALLGALSVPLYARLAERRYRLAGAHPAKATAFRAVAAVADPPATS